MAATTLLAVQASIGLLTHLACAVDEIYYSQTVALKEENQQTPDWLLLHEIAMNTIRSHTYTHICNLGAFCVQAPESAAIKYYWETPKQKQTKQSTCESGMELSEFSWPL